MAVDDLWYLRKRDADTNKRLPSKRHGRGKRWRVRWVDPETGRKREELFDKLADAELHDVNVHADISRGQYIDPAAGKITVTEYAKLWRGNQLHRDSTAERTERAIRLHITPVIGHLQLAQVRSSHLKGWVKDRAGKMAASTLRMIYSGTVVPMFTTAVNDRLIGVSPCVGVRLPDVDDGKYVIATPEQVHALSQALPHRYRAIPLVAAGAGLRGGEVFGLEDDAIGFLRREIEVRQQLKVVTGRKPFLAEPKTKTSNRPVELAQVVSLALARHIEDFPTAPVELDDETDPRKVKIDDETGDRIVPRRAARLIFTNESGDPIHRATWSHIWRTAVKAAGLPEGFGLRDLRHYYATVLIFGGANVKTVQLSMGHTTPTITLNTYVGYWPDAMERTRSLVDAALGTASTLDAAPSGTEQ